MKKIISLLLLLTLSAFSLFSCLEPIDGEAKIRIGYMAGPTGMGMAKLVHDNGGLEAGNDSYSFTKYADTATAKADLAAGNIDIICLPTNEAAAYYNTAGNNIRVLAINCLNSLYLLTDKSTAISSFSELEGKTVYTCKNGTPRLVLEYILEEANINATVSYTVDGKEMVTPADLGAQVVAGNLPIAVMPEPIVTSSLLSITKNGNADIAYSVDVDLADEWAKISDTPVTMGCIVTTSEFINANRSAVDAFLDEYKASVEFIGNASNRQTASEYVVETGVMAAAPAATKALTNLGDAISYIDGDAMKTALIAFFEAIEMNKLPDDEFYYKK